MVEIHATLEGNSQSEINQRALYLGKTYFGEKANLRVKVDKVSYVPYDTYRRNATFSFEADVRIESLP